MAAQCVVNISINNPSDAVLCRWADEVTKKYPKYVSTFAKRAILHYITTGEYLNLGIIPGGEYLHYDFLKETYCIAVSRDEIINEWTDLLKAEGVRVNMAIKDILLNSLTIADEDIPARIKSYGELIQVPLLKSKPVLALGPSTLDLAQSEPDIVSYSAPVENPTPIIEENKNPVELSKKAKKDPFAETFAASGFFIPPEDDI